MMKYGENGRELILELRRSQQQNQPSSFGCSASSGGRSLSLPPYNDRLVRDCLHDLQLHVKALQLQVEANNPTSNNNNNNNKAMTGGKLPTSVRPSILLQKAAIGRNKRCLLAYHQARLSTIIRAYWENNSWADAAQQEQQQQQSSTTSTSSSSSNNTNRLCPSEQEFAVEYEKLVQSYVAQTTAGWCCEDLRAAQHPPVQPVDKVLVRAVADHSRNNDNDNNNNTIVLESGATVDFVAGTLHYLLYTDVEPFLRDGTLERVSTEEEANQHPLSSSSAAAAHSSVGPTTSSTST